MPKIIRNSRVPKLFSVFISVYAITLFPFIFIRDDGDEVTLNHESIHIHQQRELFVLFFYILYIYDWMVGLFKYRSPSLAYARIRFEQEAYEFDGDSEYLSRRKRFAWRKYEI